MLIPVALLLAQTGLTQITFVRHGETEANATGRYNGRTINKFSKRGEEQVQRLTEWLAPRRFDAIVVSPSERALRTLAPYLRVTHQQAEVWPELYECCTQTGVARKRPPLPKPKWGPKFKIPSDLASLFVIQPGHDRLFEAPTYQDGLRQVELARARVIGTFGRSGRQVLIVSHSGLGGHMLERLAGRPALGKLHPENAKPMVYAETAGGVFIRRP